MRKHLFFVALASAIGFGNVAGAVAEELTKTHVKVIGNYSTVAHVAKVEQNFWGKIIPEMGKGQITSDYAHQDLMGVKDFQVLRLIKLGVTDFGVSDISKMAGDDPVFEGCDLAGLALDIDTARKVCEAWKPVMNRVMGEKFNAKLLALGTNPPQVFWCREKVTGIADMQGKKIRVFNKTMSDFVKALGGTSISMAFGEVVPALQRGVVDCAVTGTTSGNSAGWPEVTTHILPMYLGWSINFQAVNLKSWNRFAPDVRAFFENAFAVLEDDMWATVGRSAAEADNCNTGKDPCTFGKKAQMTIATVSDADKAAHKELMQNVVLVEWGKRCGKACAEEWNNTVGPVIGLQIPLDKL
jgi:TRAP-type C4-dicarboxylate transport system substrate-binding protein